jgi:hypothetical protein
VVAFGRSEEIEVNMEAALMVALIIELNLYPAAVG